METQISQIPWNREQRENDHLNVEFCVFCVALITLEVFQVNISTNSAILWRVKSVSWLDHFLPKSNIPIIRLISNFVHRAATLISSV